MEGGKGGEDALRRGTLTEKEGEWARGGGGGGGKSSKDEGKENKEEDEEDKEAEEKEEKEEDEQLLGMLLETRPETCDKSFHFPAQIDTYIKFLTSLDSVTDTSYTCFVESMQYFLNTCFSLDIAF